MVPYLRIKSWQRVMFYPNSKMEHMVTLLFLLFAAPIPADAEQHRGGAQLDHHLPHAHEHPRPLPQPRQGEARREDVVRRDRFFLRASRHELNKTHVLSVNLSLRSRAGALYIRP